MSSLRNADKTFAYNIDFYSSWSGCCPRNPTPFFTNKLVTPNELSKHQIIKETFEH